MKTFYITNGYNDEAIKVYCRTEEEFQYWTKVLSVIEDTLSVNIMFGNEEHLDMTAEEIAEYLDIYEVERQ